MTVSNTTRQRAWALSAGRCAICNAYLLEGKLTHRELLLGELAHVVGQKDTDRSPRGRSDLTQAERDSVDNLMLICADEHDEIDDGTVLDDAKVEWLYKVKREHEARVKHVTSFKPDQGSTVLRLIGDLRGDVVELSQNTAASTVFSSGRFPNFPLAYDRHSIEIDLRGIPGEADANAGYYDAVTAAIDELVSGKLREGIRRDEISHLSVFAFGRLPVLVHLGSRLDDTVPVDIYQRHRSTERWEWPNDEAGDATFSVQVEREYGSDEAVLVLNVSGTIHEEELPGSVGELPLYRIVVEGADATMDVIDSRAVLVRFEETVRRLLSHLEARNKTVRRLHVFAAIPLSTAVVLGRVGNPQVHPSLLVYERVNGEYCPSLEVTR